MKYKVPMIEVATVTYSYWVTVEASSEEEAIELACLNESVIEATTSKEENTDLLELYVDASEEIQCIKSKSNHHN